MKLKTLAPRLPSLKPRLQTAPNPDSWRAGKTTAGRGYGGAWQRARKRFLAANPLCLYCERKGLLTRATVVDHKTPHQGDQALFWDESNWAPLCKPCHDGEKAQEEGRRRVKQEIGLDGWPK